MSDPSGVPDLPHLAAKQREAEREVRHGNFRGALAVFKELAAADPDNAHYAARIASLEEGLQPMELVNPKAAAGAAARPMTNDLQEGEAAANIDDFATAVACYERVVADDPENELAADRLEELQGMLAAQATAPKPGIPLEAQKPPSTSSSTKEFGSSLFDEPVEAEPADPVALLETLLERIRARRK